MIQMSSLKKYSKIGAFTLFEMLLAMALLAMVAVMSVPVYQSFQVNNELIVTTDSLVQSLRTAQANSRSGNGDSPWGVRVSGGAITVFRGSSYAARNTDYDQVYPISDMISASGINEIVFAKLTGDPTPAGTMTLTSIGGDLRVITINAKGAINY